jgi:hypothetical protein
VSDSHRREAVFATVARSGLQGYTLVRIYEGHLCAGYNRAGGVLNRTADCAFVNLAECVPAWEQKQAQTHEEQEARLPEPTEYSAIKGHPNYLRFVSFVLLRRGRCPRQEMGEADATA